MNKVAAHFQIARFRAPVIVWIVVFFLAWSYLPAVSLAQQPTATLNAVTGTVLVNGQPKQQGTVLNAGDTIETQAGASVVLLLSDGSSLEVGENTQVNLSELLQAASGARNSQIKLMWGWMRAKLSPGHQQAGSSFQIDTPNAVIGVKFSQPDVEVRYDPAKQETTGVAHTVQLTATNILTNEELLVPVGSSVIIVGATITIIAGILAIAAASEAGTASAAVATTESAAATSAGATTTTTAATTTTTTTTTASTATGSTGASSAGMGTGTKVLIGAGAAVAVGGGVAALVLAGQEDADSETAESSGDLSGSWVFSGSCTGYGCTTAIDESPGCMGLEMCNCCRVGGVLSVTQSGSQLSGVSASNNILNGTVEGTDVSFTITNFSLVMPLYQATDIFTGTLSGNTITGTLEGFGDVYTSGPDVPMTWSGTFTVTINK